jgi:hypothetical protein
MNFNNVITFDNGDAPYFKWLAQNKRGFVVNALRSKKPDKLHRATCYYINERKEVGLDAYTKGDGYIKICSPNIEQLLASVSKYEKFGNSPSDKCKICNP